LKESIIMVRQTHFLIAALAILICLIGGRANAERLYSRVSQGNNVGFGVKDGWGGPMNWAGSSSAQFPRGSGNFITNDGFQIPVQTVRDLDGNGTPEDTTGTGDGGRAYMGYYTSIWAEDILTELAAIAAAGGMDMENASSDRSGTDINQVWSSLDDANLETWPREFREGFSPTGDPVVKGAETIVSHYGDSFNTWTPNNGFYMGMAFYFPDFGEANNMVFCHSILHQVTHYVKWRPNVPDIYKPSPDGWEWIDLRIHANLRGAKFGGETTRWAFHQERELAAFWRQGTISSFTPSEPAIMTYRMFEKPKWNGQEMAMSNNWAAGDGGFGFGGANRMPNLAYPNRYRAVGGEYADDFVGSVNPFTGRGDMRGWPGLLEPTDERYDQWIWGNYTWQWNIGYSSIRGMEPRDTTSLDFVMMWVPADGPITPPPMDIANMDDPGMQNVFAKAEEYDDIAQALFDIGLAGPETPRAPALTIIPGDRQVTITWSDINVKKADSFYAILEASGWNPDGYYREFDFEGYRLYRSYVGPNDSHIDKDGEGVIKPLFECSISDGNLAFHYVDKLEHDTNYSRMRNGMKVWYALVPFDKNYNATTGVEFSLPSTSSGKTWNRAGTPGAYTVIPHSNASNFVSAGIEGAVTFTAGTGDPVTATSFKISGDGSGAFTEAPVYLAPVVDFEFTPVIDERITSAKTLTVNTTGSWRVYGDRGNGYRKFELSESGGSSESAEIGVRVYGGSSNVTVGLSSPVSAAGADYALDCNFSYMSNGHFRTKLVMNMDAGGYSAGVPEVETRVSRDRYQGGYAPSHPGMIRAGRFTVTWKDAGDGNLTLEVNDVTRNSSLGFVEYPDQGYGWGFITLDAFGHSTWGNNRGTLIDEARGSTPVPFAERTSKMVSTLPADNTEEFAVWVNGLQWTFVGAPDEGTITSMPAVGTVMTVDNAWGDWNSDKTQFTQEPDPPFPGDKWTINVKPSTMNDDDIDLAKIRVVPNPYIATSYLDLSPMNRRIEFVNLPDRCTIRIYTLGGNLVNVLNHIGANRQGWGNYTDLDRLTSSVPKEYTGYDNHNGTEPWNLRNRFGSTVASGLYFFHVTDARGETYTGKFYVVL
jgi:hypothetical protein